MDLKGFESASFRSKAASTSQFVMFPGFCQHAKQSTGGEKVEAGKDARTLTVCPNPIEYPMAREKKSPWCWAIALSFSVKHISSEASRIASAAWSQLALYFSHRGRPNRIMKARFSVSTIDLEWLRASCHHFDQSKEMRSSRSIPVDVGEP